MKKKTIQQIANSIAREHGCGSATSFEVGDKLVVQHTPFGYRKKTTGQYVPNKYLSNFGWKNTYYQNAETHVVIPTAIAETAVDYNDYLIAKIIK